MTPLALTFLVLAILLVWGGLLVAAVFFVRSGASRGDVHPGRDTVGGSSPRH